MFSFINIRRYFKKFLNPSLYMGGLDYVLQIWREAEGKDKGILLLVFSPMFLCLIGFVFSIIHFVLFVLPSFLFSFLGWGLLSAIFGSGGKYFYKHFTGHEIRTPNKDGVIEADFVVDDVEEEEKAEEPEPAKKTTTRKKSSE